MGISTSQRSRAWRGTVPPPRKLESIHHHHHHRVACPGMDVAVSTSDLHAEGLFMENTSAKSISPGMDILV